ncbi:MAG: IS630 family transposase, partial [Thermoplasmata archaeon]
RKIVFLDEVHFYQHGTRMRVWIPPEDIDPTVLQEPGRKGISVFGAIRISDGRLITSITEVYNAFTFVEFLYIVHKKFPDSVFVLDNALYHHASIVTDYAFLSQIDLLFMPPYSPELNPIERVWKFIRKRATHNKYFALLDDLRDALLEQFNLYSRPNETIRKLCAVN